PVEIAAGPDGNLWFTEGKNPGRIGRITPTGAIDEFTTGLTPNSPPNRIAAGPDGNLGFTEIADPGRVGRIGPPGGGDAARAGRDRKSPSLHRRRSRPSTGAVTPARYGGIDDSAVTGRDSARR